VSKFYFALWTSWLSRLTLCSLFLASLASFFISLFIYISQGSQPLSVEVLIALGAIFKFWFMLLWSPALLIALFRGMKYIFNKEYGAYRLELLNCEVQKESIEFIGYGDLVRVWRRWFMLLIWLVGAEMIIAVVFSMLFSLGDLFEWFNIYLLYAFVLMAGYFSFIILIARCKKVRVVKC